MVERYGNLGLGRQVNAPASPIQRAVNRLFIKQTAAWFQSLEVKRQKGLLQIELDGLVTSKTARRTGTGRLAEVRAEIERQLAQFPEVLEEVERPSVCGKLLRKRSGQSWWRWGWAMLTTGASAAVVTSSGAASRGWGCEESR